MAAGQMILFYVMIQGFNVVPPDEVGTVLIVSAVCVLMESGLDLTALDGEQEQRKEVREYCENPQKLVFLDTWVCLDTIYT